MSRVAAILCLSSVALARPPLDAMGKDMLNPIREQALRPVDLIARLHLSPEARIADVGAGPGFLTLTLARAVPRGSVLATDIRADYLELAAERATAAGLRNVKTRVVPADRPALDVRSIDLVMLCQVDHYLSERVSYFKALAQALRPGGRIAIVNYLRHRDDVLAAVGHAGLHVVDEWRPSSAFFMIVVKPQ